MKKNKFLSLIALSMSLGILSACSGTEEKKPDNKSDKESGNISEKESGESGEKQEENPEPKHEHSFAEEWQKDENQHWHAATCEHTNEKGSLGNHNFGDGNVCTVCGYEKEIPHEHTYATEWSKDISGHWHAATCGHDVKGEFAAHTYGEGDTCSVCGMEKPVTELYYFVNTDTKGVKLEDDRGYSKTEPIALKVNETIKFGDVSGSYVSYRTGLTIEGDANGFTVNGGVFKAGYEASYIFEIFDGKVTIKANNMANPFVGVIYAGGQKNLESPFRFKNIDGGNSAVIYRITSATIPKAPVAITLQIEKNGTVVAIDSLSNEGAGADFTLSQDKKTLTYVGAGDISYDFVLTDSYASNNISLLITLH